VVSPSTVSPSYRINGSFDGTYNHASMANESSLAYLSLTSGAGSPWFDNVSVTTADAPVPISGAVSLLTHSLASLVVLRRRFKQWAVFTRHNGQGRENGLAPFLSN